MNQFINFSNLGGLYVYQDSLEYMQAAYGSMFDGLAAGLGDKYIVSGVDSVAGVYSNGIIVINGELLPFLGGVGQSFVTVETITTDEQYDDGLLKPAYTVKRAKFAPLGGGINDYPFAEFKRLPMQGGILGNIAGATAIARASVAFEPEVILSGCLVTSINSGASTLNISAGKVLFDNAVVDTVAYSGAYPCYLTPNGSYVTVLPTSGLFITFDPHTSQRYVDVLHRATTPSGKIEMYETLSDRFDGSGTGKWEMLGFELMTAMQARVPLGYWFDGNSVGGVTDTDYETVGYSGGTNGHTVTQNNIQAFNISKPGSAGTGGVGNPVAGDQSNDGTVSFTIGVSNPTPISHVQPYTIIVYVKRS